VWVAISDEGRPVDLERIYVNTVPRDPGAFIAAGKVVPAVTVWSAEGLARLGKLRLGAEIPGMQSSVSGEQLLQPRQAYVIEGFGKPIGGSQAGHSTSGMRNFQIDEHGRVEMCGPCEPCEYLGDAGFGPCSED
jgi:hypothetical protein